MRKIWAALGALLVLLFVAYRVLAETNTLTATAPTMNTDGSALTDLASIDVYHSSTRGGPYQLIESVPFSAPGAVFTYSHGEQIDGLHCYVVTATRANAARSAYSNEACKVIDTLLPSSVTDLSVR